MRALILFFLALGFSMQTQAARLYPKNPEKLTAINETDTVMSYGKPILIENLESYQSYCGGHVGDMTTQESYKVILTGDKDMQGHVRFLYYSVIDDRNAVISTIYCVIILKTDGSPREILKTHTGDIFEIR